MCFLKAVPLPGATSLKGEGVYIKMQQISDPCEISRIVPCWSFSLDRKKKTERFNQHKMSERIVCSTLYEFIHTININTDNIGWNNDVWKRKVFGQIKKMIHIT